MTEEQPPVAGWPLVGLGYCTMRPGRADEARRRFLEAVVAGRLVGAAEAIRESIGYQLWSATALLHEQTMACLSGAAHPSTVERRISAGLLLSYEEAIALAGS